MSLPGFSLKMLQPDILHICHLGTARDLVGSALRELSRVPGIFQGRTQLLRLRDATERLQTYVRANGLSLALRRLTSKSLGFSDKGFPELKAKGYDTFLVLRWLVVEVNENRPANFDLLRTCLWSLDSFLSAATNAAKSFAHCWGHLPQKLHPFGGQCDSEKPKVIQNQTQISHADAPHE